ncbi:hypothetical protein ABIA50_002004 [Bacillus subtilis]
MRIFKKAVFVIMISFLIATVNVNTAHAAIDVSAKSAIIIDGASGRVLYAKDEHQKRRIASITKIMTAVLAIESGKMDQTGDGFGKGCQNRRLRHLFNRRSKSEAERSCVWPDAKIRKRRRCRDC